MYNRDSNKEHYASTIFSTIRLAPWLFFKFSFSLFRCTRACPVGFLSRRRIAVIREIYRVYYRDGEEERRQRNPTRATKRRGCRARGRNVGTKRDRERSRRIGGILRGRWKNCAPTCPGLGMSRYEARSIISIFFFLFLSLSLSFLPLSLHIFFLYRSISP